jgi:serine/threonine protein kinase
MGVVFKARDRETGDVVALKVLQAGLSADPGLLERFKNELRLARKITHKNVCRIHEFNRSGDLAYISMEFVDGESLREVLKRSPKMPPAQGTALVQQVCAGLREAHAQGVVHRDLKPENIMVDRAGVVKLMDFGIARSLDGATTHTRGIIGTPAYMAPEQAEGRPVDHRTDIYSLGLILYEMFTGVQAFRGQTMVEVVLKQIRDTAPRPSEIEPGMPAQLEAAIIRCLQKDPAQRFQTMDELDGALAGKFVTMPPPAAPVHVTPIPIPPKREIKKKARVWIILTILGTFFLIKNLTTNRDKTPPRETKQREEISALAPEPPAPVKPSGKKAAKPVEPDGKETPPEEDQAVKDAQQEIDKVKKEMPPIVQKGLGALGQFIPPAQLEEMLKKADDALEAGRFDEARQGYISVLVLSPTNARAKEGIKKVGAAQRDAIQKKYPKKQP